MRDPETPKLPVAKIEPWAKARIQWEQAQTRARLLPEHVGAWLDRMLDEPVVAGLREKAEPHVDRRWLYRDAVEALRLGQDPARDAAAVQTWRTVYARHVQTFGVGTDPAIQRFEVVLEAKTRILLHAATERTVTEGSVLLHHTYGVPYLPGSALKGAIRKALSQRHKYFDISKLPVNEMNSNSKKDDPFPDAILGKGNTGTDDHAGLIDLLDALWIPERPPGERGPWSPLCVDVVTPHHVDAINEPPTDLDAPVPTHRLTLAPGCRFRVVLEASPEFSAEWLRWLGEEVLPEALALDGLGAWTSAGYGRLDRPGRQSRAPARATPAPSVVPTAASPWTPADLSRKPNTGELSARLSDGRVARAPQDRARVLFDALPAEAVDTLRSGRSIRAEVQIDPVGKNWSITAIRARDSK